MKTRKTKHQNVFYKWTNNYDESQPNNNYEFYETLPYVFGENYTFGDLLKDNDINYFVNDKDETEYIILDNDGHETGERFLIVRIEVITTIEYLGNR